MKPQPAPASAERGMILVVVLWLVAMMTVLVVALNTYARNNLSLSGIAADRLRNEVLLESGLDAAAGLIEATPAQQRVLFAGTPKTVDLGGGVMVDLAITDAAGFVDINRADMDLLKGLVQNAGISGDAGTAIVAAIGKWRDTVNPPDQQNPAHGQTNGQTTGPAIGQTTGQPADTGQPVDPLQPPGNADQAQPNAPGNQPSAQSLPPGAFFSLAQLYGIQNVAAGDIDRIQPLIGLYSKDGKVNPLAAPQAVLQAVPGMTPDQIGAVMQARAAGRYNDQAVAQIVQQMPKFLAMNEAKSFIVSVKGVSGPNVIAGSQLNAVIVLDASRASPYRVMSWSW